jgi:hypothetical protein
VAALRAAAKDRLDAYVEEHTNLLPLDTKSRLLPFKPNDTPGPVARNLLDSTYYGDGPRTIERPAWADDSWGVCTEHGDGDVPTHDTILGDYTAKNPIDTLSLMLRGLHGMSRAYPKIRFYSL